MLRIKWRATVLSGAILLAGCHREKGATGHEGLEPATVSVVAVEGRDHRAAEAVVGTVRSRTRAAIESKVSGRIERMEAAPGRMVRAGDLLVEIEIREIRARVEQAQALLRQAEQDFERIEGLFKQEAVTRSEWEAVDARRRVARAMLVEAEAMAANARMTAPFDGVVTRRHADVGDLAVPGRSLLELEDPNSLRFEADVPASLAGWVKLGDVLKVDLTPGSGVVEATLSEMEPSADDASRTFRVRLDLPPGTVSRGGSFGRMQLPMESSPVTTVSTNAVTVRGQMELVWVVAEGRAHLRLVKSGKRFGGDFEILSGLEPGERVVVSGGKLLKDGQPVVAQ